MRLNDGDYNDDEDEAVDKDDDDDDDESDDDDENDDDDYNDDDENDDGRLRRGRGEKFTVIKFSRHLLLQSPSRTVRYLLTLL